MSFIFWLTTLQVSSTSTNEIASFRFPWKVFLKRKLTFKVSENYLTLLDKSYTKGLLFFVGEQETLLIWLVGGI